ncbi:MAG: aminotransferase class V-fold PLP-dependent enzyme [Gemmatimonadetes bacterium]|nr:aminotransferase class V-fold PLP-dependent enzyme [Gemmatimonadota bacterium]
MERHTGRRQFLKQLSGGAAAILAWPRSQEPLPVPPPVRGSTAGEQFWRLVREAFLIPRDRIYLNVGTLGPQPRTVVEAVEQHARRVAMTLPPGVAWDRLKERLGHFVNCDPAGLVFPRNTTEGMSFVAQGLELRAGDEVVTTDHEHVGGLSCWQLLAARRGVRLRQLSLPVPPASAAEVLERIEAALTRRTRVVSVSHLTFTTGLVLPVGEIVQLCRSKGIVSVIDGAHPPGLIPVDLERMDPDFYASSPHKWLLAPQGTGFLYIREDWRERLWPTIASEGWNDRRLGAQRFNHLGTMDESRLAGLEAALEFQETIGPELIQARIRELRQHLAQQLVGLPRLQVVSPADGDLVAGMVSFAVQGVTALELQRRLAELGNIRTRVIGEYDYGWMRLSPHIYNSPQELDRVISLLQQLV